MLGRRAAKLFAHVKDVLNRAGPTSAIGADYSSVLRSDLLANAHYCSLVPANTFQGKWLTSQCCCTWLDRAFSKSYVLFEYILVMQEDHLGYC